MRSNLRPGLSKDAVSLLQQRSVAREVVSARFAQHLPSDADIRYLTDSDMDHSAKKISQRLAEAGVVRDAYAAYSNLRPPAYRADLWRYMALWDEGGVYLDMNIHLLAPLTTWVNFESDTLVMVEDRPKQCYWNAMMAAAPRQRPLEELIREVVTRINQHRYGRGPLDITGPRVAYFILNSAHPKVEYKWNGFSVRERRSSSYRSIARKDQTLHYTSNSDNYYPKLWTSRSVFLDQAGARTFKSAYERGHRWKVEAPQDHVDGASASSEIQSEGVEHVADSFPGRGSGVRSVHVKPEGVPSAVDWPANL